MSVSTEYLPRTTLGFGRLALCWAGMAALVGCVSPTRAFDEQFGRTVPALRAQQIADPQASARNENRSVAGMDGRAAREGVERYYRSFREPPRTTNVFNIGVGSGPDAGGGGR